MGVSGVGFFFVTLFVLMSIGSYFYGAYDYLGRYPALLLTPTGIGFFAPLMILWWLEKRGAQGRRALLGTLRFVLVLFLIPIILFCVFGFWATFEPLDTAIQIRARIGYGGIALTGSAAVVWLLARRDKATDSEG